MANDPGIGLAVGGLLSGVGGGLVSAAQQSGADTRQRALLELEHGFRNEEAQAGRDFTAGETAKTIKAGADRSAAEIKAAGDRTTAEINAQADTRAAQAESARATAGLTKARTASEAELSPVNIKTGEMGTADDMAANPGEYRMLNRKDHVALTRTLATNTSREKIAAGNAQSRLDAAKARGNGSTDAIANHILDENRAHRSVDPSIPELSYADAIGLAKRAPNANAEELQRERLALQFAVGQRNYSRDPQGTLAAARAQFSLKPQVTPGTAAPPAPAPAPAAAPPQVADPPAPQGPVSTANPAPAEPGPIVGAGTPAPGAPPNAATPAPASVFATPAPTPDAPPPAVAPAPPPLPAPKPIPANKADLVNGQAYINARNQIGIWNATTQKFDPAPVQ